jgi:hypothetical protein
MYSHRDLIGVAALLVLIDARGSLGSKSIEYAFGALFILLLVFQFMLRPGIRFY